MNPTSPTVTDLLGEIAPTSAFYETDGARRYMTLRESGAAAQEMVPASWLDQYVKAHAPFTVVKEPASLKSRIEWYQIIGQQSTFVTMFARVPNEARALALCDWYNEWAALLMMLDKNDG